MQVFVWILRFLVVVVLVWFAIKNTDPVTIHGLPTQSWQAPLVFALLIAFVGGVVIGLLAWVPTVVRQRRELGKLRRMLAQQPSASVPPAPAGDEPPHGI